MPRNLAATLALTALTALAASSRAAPQPEKASSSRALPLEAARAAAKGAAPAAPRADGEAIRAGVRAKLAGDSRFARLRKVEVDSEKGLVTLSGSVATKADRAAAGELVSSVKGVLMIYNELEVEHSSRADRAQ
jgi:osmotically-inducible protein OsmY